MKVYVVTASSGAYEDFYSWIEKVFANKQSAIEYVTKYNSKIVEKDARIFELDKLLDDAYEIDDEYWTEYQRALDREYTALIMCDKNGATWKEFTVFE